MGAIKSWIRRKLAIRPRNKRCVECTWFKLWQPNRMPYEGAGSCRCNKKGLRPAGLIASYDKACPCFEEF